MKIIIRQKGGPTSGNYGHAGRPGLVGGSASSSVITITSIDPLNGRDSGQRLSPNEEHIINTTVSEVLKISGMQASALPTIVLANNIGGHGRSSNLRGKTYIFIDVNSIHKSFTDGTISKMSDNDYKDWYYGIDKNQSSYLAHVVAHELGHAYMKGKSQMSADLRPIPGGSKGRVELSSFVNGWNTFFGANKSLMSGYSRYYVKADEGFADAFANYTTGLALPALVRTWLQNNIG